MTNSPVARQPARGCRIAGGEVEESDMNAIQGTVRNGQVVLDGAFELPEGTRVEIVPIEASQPTFGMREEDWPTTSEGIAALLARMDSVEPSWLPPEEDVDWRSSLCKQKEIDKAQFFKDTEKLRSMWE
jgi:hypothetical protein